MLSAQDARDLSVGTTMEEVLEKLDNRVREHIADGFTFIKVHDADVGGLSRSIRRINARGGTMQSADRFVQGLIAALNLLGYRCVFNEGQQPSYGGPSIDPYLEVHW